MVLWNYDLKCLSNDEGMPLIQAMYLILKSRTFGFCVLVRETHDMLGLGYRLFFSFAYGVLCYHRALFHYWVHEAQRKLNKLVCTCCGSPSQAGQKITPLKLSNLTGAVPAYTCAEVAFECSYICLSRGVFTNSMTNTCFVCLSLLVWVTVNLSRLWRESPVKEIHGLFVHVRS